MNGVKENKEKGGRATLFAAITVEQHEALRYIAYKEHKSIAELTREALEAMIVEKSKEYPIAGFSR